jgi:hypothetical protein
MGLYDCMYLVPKEQYDGGGRVQARGAVDGVGGDVNESQINNFEVSHGGTVVIREDGGKPLRSVADAEKKEEEEKEEEETKKKKKKKNNSNNKKANGQPEGKEESRGGLTAYENGSAEDGNYEGGKRVFPIMKLGGGEYAGSSAKLRAAGKPPNAVSSVSAVVGRQGETGRREAIAKRTDPVRREAILTAARQSNERAEQVAAQEQPAPAQKKSTARPPPTSSPPLPPPTITMPTPSVARAQKEALDAFVQLRMKQLQGKLPKRAKPRDLDKARAMVHELRNVHKNAVKASAAKKLLPHQTPLPDEDDDEFMPAVVRPPPRIAKKVRFAVTEPDRFSYDQQPEEEEDLPSKRRGKRAYANDPWEQAKKKSKTAGIKTGRHWPDMLGWQPLSKKHRRLAEKAARRDRDDDDPTVAKRRRVGGYAYKRAREEEDLLPAPKRRLAVPTEAVKRVHAGEEEQEGPPAAKRRPPKEQSATRGRKRLPDELALPSLSKKHRLQAAKRRLEEEIFGPPVKAARRTSKRAREGDELFSVPASKRRLAETSKQARKRPHDADMFGDPYLLPKKITKKSVDDLERRVLEEEEENWRDLMADVLYSDNAQ